MGWNDYPLRSISVPADHGATDPYVYIGPDDPLAAKLGLDASVTYHFGSHNSGFVMGVNDTSTPTNDFGTFDLFVTSDQNGGSSHQVLTSAYNPVGAALTTILGEQVTGSNTEVLGDSVSVLSNSGVLLDSGAGVGQVTVLRDKLVDSRSHQYMRGEANSASVSFTGLTSSTVAVGFAHTFSAIPKVMTNINNGAGATAQWHSRAISVTTTGFTLLVFSASVGTWSNVDVQWTAQEPA